VTTVAGERAAGLEELYAGAYRRLVVQVTALTGDLAEAEDVVQEAYARALARWSRLSRYDAPEVWLRTVAFNLARSRWRRAKRAVALRGAARTAAAPSVDRVALVTALRALPTVQREAIVLHHIGELSVAEIAAQLSVPEGTVKTRLARGRARLAALLAEGGDDD